MNPNTYLYAVFRVLIVGFVKHFKEQSCQMVLDRSDYVRVDGTFYSDVDKEQIL